jgi:phosphate transport system substrate-binding protein
MRLRGVIVAVLAFAAAAGCSGAPRNRPAAIEPAAPAHVAEPPGELPFYVPATGVSGRITVIGMATTMNLVARVSAAFRPMYPEVSLLTTTDPAKTGLAALAENRADIVPMSRELTPEEVHDFTLKAGHPPTQIKVAGDALAIFVEKKNPIAGLTLAQLDGIFSRTHLRGGSSIETWGQAGLTGDWADRPMVLLGYGRGDATHLFFKEHVLKGGDFRISMQVEGSGSSVSQGVASDPDSIACASIFFACKRVRAVPLAGDDGHFYAPTPENIRSGRYPLSRYLYVCVNKRPHEPLAGPAAEFLRFLLSREGQRIVADNGNVALDPAVAAEGRRTLQE